MDQLLKPSQAARLIINNRTGKSGISPNRVRQFCEAGRLGQRVGRGWVISINEIEAFNATPRPQPEGGRRARRMI